MIINVAFSFTDTLLSVLRGETEIKNLPDKFWFNCMKEHVLHGDKNLVALEATWVLPIDHKQHVSYIKDKNKNYDCVTRDQCGLTKEQLYLYDQFVLAISRADACGNVHWGK